MTVRYEKISSPTQAQQAEWSIKRINRSDTTASSTTDNVTLMSSLPAYSHSQSNIHHHNTTRNLTQQLTTQKKKKPYSRRKKRSRKKKESLSYIGQIFSTQPKRTFTSTPTNGSSPSSTPSFKENKMAAKEMENPSKQKEEIT